MKVNQLHWALYGLLLAAGVMIGILLAEKALQRMQLPQQTPTA